MPAIKKPNQHFDVTTYTGNSSTTQNINTGISPDFVWIKSRTSGTGHHSLIDRVRGDIALNSNQTVAEYSVGDFNMNTNGTIDVPFFANDYSMNTSGNSYVAWNWKAGGAAVTNTSGTISSQVSANPIAGFSVVTYTGNGTAGATIGHGLGVAPSMMIAKNRSSGGSASYEWTVYHTSLGATKAVFLNDTGAAATDAGYWYNTAPTSTLITVPSNTRTNVNGSNFVIYCFAQVAGYSAFGSYTGNGSTDGSFVYLGFKPKFIMLKNSTSATSWSMLDTSRNTYNISNTRLFAESSQVEDTSQDTMDILSNGFKLRTTGLGVNGNGSTIIYMAFAEAPFKYASAR